MRVKLMGADGKSCSVHDYVVACIFHEREDAAGWWASMEFDDGSQKHVLLEGNAYLLDESGSTFDRFVLPS